MAGVEVAADVMDEIGALPDDVEARVKDKLREAGGDPTRYLKPLRGRDGYRVRIGDYRAIVDWDRNDDVLYVVEFGHRRNVYD